jgi:hypothetical protein
VDGVLIDCDGSYSALGDDDKNSAGRDLPKRVAKGGLHESGNESSRNCRESSLEVVLIDSFEPAAQ